MERILSIEEMKQAEDYTINKLGLSRETLVERAGECVALEIKKRFAGGRVLVCVGKGYNGEDGKVISEILSKTHGFSVATINVFNGIFKLFEKKYDIIIDCILGTGLNRDVEGKIKTAIDYINKSGAYVVSCDIPTGLNGNTGKIMGVCVKANLTIAIQEYKLGHFLNDGPDFCGEIISKDIGISVWEENFAEKLSQNDLEKFFTKQKRNVNKGSFGKTCIIGGSYSFSGSIFLSYNAILALKMGNGYSNLVVPDIIFNSVCGKYPECIITPVKSKNGFFAFDKKALESLLKYDSIAFGMGVGITEDNYKIIEYLIDNYSGRLLIDADGLNSISKFGIEILNKKRKCEIILTPHVKEFSRLSNYNVNEILDNPILLAKEFAQKYKITLLLKNAVSIITDGAKVIINTTGSAGMAKAGSGDVLSGIIAGQLSKEHDVIDAVASSCYIFGKAGEKVSKDLTDYVMTASDITEYLPKLIKSL